MVGRFARLRPVTPADHGPLYKIAVSQEVNLRWRFRGVIPSFEAFVAAFRPADVTAQFTITTRHSDEAQGLVVAYNTNLRDLHTYVGAFVSSNLIGEGIGVESALLFCQYLFMTWPFDKIYLEVVEYNLALFRSGIDKLTRVEGRFSKHVYYGGRHWDVCILALYREDLLRYIGNRTSKHDRRNRPPDAMQDVIVSVNGKDAI